MIKRTYSVSRNTSGGTFAAIFGLVTMLFGLGIAVAGIIGWVLNILAIVATPLLPLTTMLILRVIGIFVVPLGSVLGLFV